MQCTDTERLGGRIMVDNKQALIYKNTLAESFYDVQMLNCEPIVCQINLSNENIKMNTGVSRFQK